MRDEINIQPNYKQSTLPCEGNVGDLLVLTPLGAEELDHSTQGLASLWFCIRAGDGKHQAVWARVQFDGVASCDAPIPDPPQNRPPLKRG
ncbi:hypothetical protein ACIRRA_34035 [Nocardia sp. NPDC101769]|uniref:hypothetical protein n=1 Tax=Nocardia sp. NPDC101769 TaxID=3364333 RepID=UPI00380FF784